MKDNDPLFELWSHMNEQHDLLLLESEVYDILQICRRIDYPESLFDPKAETKD